MARPRKKQRDLPPCVYHRHGAYWFVKRGVWTRLGASRPEAMAAYAGLVAEPSGGVSGLVDKVLTHIRPTIAANTLKQYETAARHIKARLAEFAPEQVRPKHIAAIKRDMADTPNMANRVLTFLRVVFAQAVEWQIVEMNPALGIKPFREHKRDRYITDAEYAAIYQVSGDRLQVIMDLLYLTGQRVRDVLEIRRADLTEDGVAFKQKKTDARLVVRWTPDLEATVARAKRLTGPAMTLLKGKYGRPPDHSSVSLQWRQACKAAGVKDAQLRDLRAKSLTDAKRQGLDATALAGHTSAQMTRRYLRNRDVPVVVGPSFGHPFDSAEKDA